MANVLIAAMHDAAKLFNRVNAEVAGKRQGIHTSIKWRSKNAVINTEVSCVYTDITIR